MNATPQVNGYKFMRTPSPAPGVDFSPFMTWGEIEGTPVMLDGSQTPSLSERQSFKSGGYKMPKASRK